MSLLGDAGVISCSCTAASSPSRRFRDKKCLAPTGSPHLVACASVNAQDAKTMRKNSVYRANLWSARVLRKKIVGFINE